MGNQSSHTKELGRQPNDKEIMILYRLQKLLYTRLLQSPQVYLITSIPSLIEIRANKRILEMESGFLFL
ncbi:unnamed protein product [Albugo candida]|uniref:Uncharacterized protein n=1 Tax=Albugo candida TaxID=65357 RepID=A0A024GEW2_9STRA|nr:unnamed protein product [Albugo candida]|eukprot:CCI45065.1 unnamed protein product [Albugo candida]